MKVKLITESNKKFQRMQTAFGWGRPADNVKTFAIISYENPLGWKNSEEEEFIKKYQAWLNNPKKYNADAKALSKDELKNKMLDSIKRKGDETLKYGHFSYVNIEGSYFGQREKSRIIFNLPYIDAQGLARDYGQESFFFAKVVNNNPVIAYYETKDACKTYKLVDISNTISDRTDADDFFSKYGKKFKIDMNVFGDSVSPIENTYEFEESMDETRTAKSRAMHRRLSYQKGNK